MATTLKKSADKENARALRAALHEAVSRGEISLQNAVKQMRKVSRLTQAEFAAHRGVSTKVIKEIESGKGNPTVQTLNKIGSFFGLEVAFVRTETLNRQEPLYAPHVPPGGSTQGALEDAMQIANTHE